MNPLPAQPFYFPLRHGRYDVAPGLTKLGRDFGGGAADGQIFQIDDRFPTFRAAKLASRARAMGDYVCTSAYQDEVAGEVATFIVERLAAEHPQHFRRERTRGSVLLHCGLTNEALGFDPQMRLAGVTGSSDVQPAYADALDALGCQVQEDLAVVSTDPAASRHWLSATHVCLPNGWAPNEKIGRSFAEVHAPVAGMAEMNRRGDEFVAVMIGATHPLVRWAWGATFDDRLDHHPRHRRTPFDPHNPRAFLRVERQTIAGFPARGASLFTIRTYLYDVADVRRDAESRMALASAVRTMSPESRTYKGLFSDTGAFLAWLDSV